MGKSCMCINIVIKIFYFAVPSARSARPSYARAPSNVVANNANNANNAKVQNGVSESISSQVRAPKVEQNSQGL